LIRREWLRRNIEDCRPVSLGFERHLSHGSAILRDYRWRTCHSEDRDCSAHKCELCRIVRHH